MKFCIHLLSLLLIISSIGCDDNSYLREIETWKKERIEYLKSENGWLNIVGLYWLNEGENTIGSDSSNSIIFPENAPCYIGSVILDSNRVYFKSAPEQAVTWIDERVEEIELQTDKSGDATLLKTTTLGFFIIERGDQLGIRLRDYDSPGINSLDYIDAFPVNSDWKIPARFIQFEEPVIINLPNVLGMVEKTKISGKLEFMVDHQALEFYPMDAGERLFIIFADETSGAETYGGGRFMYVDKPDSKGNTEIDFNMAYNPPCVFTPYATCPLPPKENFLSVKILAGEKNLSH